MEVLGQPLLPLTEGMDRRFTVLRGLGPLILERRKLGVQVLFLCA
jgi:hypothetical protein